MSETYASQVSFENIAAKWPDGREPPPLLKDFCAFFATQPKNSLGQIRLFGERMNDWWIENGADLWLDFGIFGQLPDGSIIGQWFRGAELNPLVYLGSEGDVAILAADFEEFLAKWALAPAHGEAPVEIAGHPVAMPYDFGARRGAADARPALQDLLRERLGCDPAGLLRVPSPSEPLSDFFDGWVEEVERRNAADPALATLATALAAYAPRGKKPRDRATLRINVAGARCEIGSFESPMAPLAIERHIAPLVLAAREARAQGRQAPRGLWHQATLSLTPEGQCRIGADWSAPPTFRDGSRVMPADIAADLSRYPRSAGWIEPWMRE